MSNSSSLGKRFERWSILAALLVFPAVILQTAGAPYTIWGEVLSVVIWAFFVAEVSVMLWLAPDNLIWIRSHVFEVSVVVLSCPALLMLAEGGSIFSLTPLLVLGRLMRLLRFVKLVKVAKVMKTFKIVRKNGGLSRAVVIGLTTMTLVLVAGILGMVMDHHAHNLWEGLGYWLNGFGESSEVGSMTLLASGATLVVVVVIGIAGHRLGRVDGHHQD